MCTCMPILKAVPLEGQRGSYAYRVQFAFTLAQTMAGRVLEVLFINTFSSGWNITVFVLKLLFFLY